MNHSMVIKALESNAATFRALLSGVSKEIHMWKPAPEKWNLLEIACHLYDEEREDFRARVKHVLFTSAEPMPKIDPLSWVNERKYAEQDYEKKVSAFLSERAESIKWLESLSNPDWNSFYNHPKVGPITAEFLLANWLAHDYLHFRQITRTKYLFLKESSGMSLDYAGEW
jgi:hypothetical protein